MAGTEETIALDFRQDSADHYLIGDQIWYSSLFSNMTISAIERDGPAGPDRHILDLSRLEDTVPEADYLVSRSWKQAVFVGKLMTSGRKDEQRLLETRQEKGRPHKEPEEIARLARKHAGFHTALFVTRPLYGYGSESPDTSTEADDAQVVAGVRSDDSRSLRVVFPDVEEHYYDEQYGTRAQLTDFSEDVWRSIEALHRRLYDQASDELAARMLAEEAGTQLRMV